jgi:hypothetical protein
VYKEEGTLNIQNLDSEHQIWNGVPLTGEEIVLFEVERNSRLSTFWVKSIFGVESLSVLSLFYVESHSEFSHSELSPFRVESIQGGVYIFGIVSIQG